jgi:hypothetical protein
MSHRSYAVSPRRKMALVLATSVLLSLGSPFVAVSSASDAGGAQRPVSSGFGDCKNDNSGLHLGYVCDPTDGGGGNTIN